MDFMFLSFQFLNPQLYIVNKRDIVTARIRRLGEGNVFSLFTSGGGGSGPAGGGGSGQSADGGGQVSQLTGGQVR